jgi:hypothetical protein
MQIADRPGLVSETVSRVINNAPVSEVLRVYSMAVQSELDDFDDMELLEAVGKAGYSDLVEKYAPEDFNLLGDEGSEVSAG